MRERGSAVIVDILWAVLVLPHAVTHGMLTIRDVGPSRARGDPLCARSRLITHDLPKGLLSTSESAFTGARSCPDTPKIVRDCAAFD